MAVFSLGSGTELNNLDDLSKVKSYLFQLTEELQYMFNNLDPQDNYSELARLTMVTDGERQASIEASLDAIRLNYVSKDGIVSAINLSEELIQIEASKIKLEGVVTVNGNLKVGLDGSIEATNGKFSGDIEASNISGSTIKGSYIGDKTEQFYVMYDSMRDKVVVGLGEGFEIRGKILHGVPIGNWANPVVAGDNERIAIDAEDGEAGFETLYCDRIFVSGITRDLGSEIAEIWQRIEAIDDGGEDDPPVGGDPL